MNKKQETIADIVAEMRKMYPEAPKCEPNVSGQFVHDEMIWLANRIEAAHKRETDCIHRAMVLITGIEMENPEDPPRLWTALDDAYNALSDALGTDGDATADMTEAEATGRHFVVKSSRNGAKMREALEKAFDTIQGFICGQVTREQNRATLAIIRSALGTASKGGEA